jgi:hypothetical protein
MKRRNVKSIKNRIRARKIMKRVIFRGDRVINFFSRSFIVIPPDLTAAKSYQTNFYCQGKARQIWGMEVEVF